MRRRLFSLMTAVALFAVLLSCAPVQVEKRYTEYYYDKEGKLVKEYTESVVQTPERMPPIHLKNQDLYE